MAVYQQTVIESDPDAYGLESPTIIPRTPPAMINPFPTDLTLEEHSVIRVKAIYPAPEETYSTLFTSQITQVLVVTLLMSTRDGIGTVV